jgi:class 3 adenylate cyclase
VEGRHGEVVEAMDLQNDANEVWLEDEGLAVVAGPGESHGFLRSLVTVRKLEPAMAKRVSSIVAFTASSAGLFSVATSLLAPHHVANWQAQFWLGTWGLVTGAVFAILATRGVSFLLRHDAPIYLGLILVTSMAVTCGLYFSGPKWTIVAGIYALTLIFAFYLVSFWAAIIALALTAAQFGLVLTFRTGYTEPVLQWVFLVIVLSAVGAIVGQLLGGVEEAAESERRARAALANLNADLEFRVDEQVDELARLGRLRRFLPPKVAEAIVDSNQSDITVAHRQIIAVLFCDLRGFTHFSAHNEPEDVMEVLDAYYKKAGFLFAETGATIGGFAGDGVMSFFNDPVPHDDPAGAAVELGVRLRAALAPDVETWHRRGYQLGIGMGVAFGYATLGLIGCEGRYDYTALGPVVNLASRLCNSAQHDEILIDDRTFDAVSDRVEVEEFQLSIKGLAEPIRAQRVLAWHQLHLALEPRTA